MYKLLPFGKLLTTKEKKCLEIVFFIERDIVGNLGKKEMTHLYFILEGCVNLENSSTKTPLYSLFNLNKGTLVGVPTLFEKIDSKWSIRVVSKEFKAIKIPVGVIERLREGNIEFNTYLTNHFWDYILKYWELSQIKAIYGTKGLISYKLIQNAKKNYIFLRNISSFVENLNISNVNFYKIINQLIDEKVISKSGNSILILNPKKMKALYSNVESK